MQRAAMRPCQAERKMIIKNELPETALKTSDFAYELPEERIAQTPIEPRDASRLMVLNRAEETIEHKHFYDILDYLREGDTLVINDSRVIPARIMGKKINSDGSEGADCEVLLLRQHEQDVWEALVRPGRRLKVGAKIDFAGILTGEITDVIEDGNRKLRFTYDPAKFTNIYEVLNKKVQEINKKLATYKHIGKVELRSEPFEKTTSKKIKRNLVK